jgi:hypothetical protein
MDHDTLVMFHGIAGVLGGAVNPGDLDPIDPPCPVTVVGVIARVDGRFPIVGVRSGRGGGRGGGDERGSGRISILAAGSEQEGEQGDGQESSHVGILLVGHRSIMRLRGAFVKV